MRRTGGRRYWAGRGGWIVCVRWRPTFSCKDSAEFFWLFCSSCRENSNNILVSCTVYFAVTKCTHRYQQIFTFCRQGTHIEYWAWDTKVLWVFFIVPNQHFLSRQDGLERAVVNFSQVLEGKQVLFTFVARTADETHPAWNFFVTTVNITRQFAVFKDLRDVKQRYYQWNYRPKK